MVVKTYNISENSDKYISENIPPGQTSKYIEELIQKDISNNKLENKKNQKTINRSLLIILIGAATLIIDILLTIFEKQSNIYLDIIFIIGIIIVVNGVIELIPTYMGIIKERKKWI